MTMNAAPLSGIHRLPAVLAREQLTDRPLVVDAYTAGATVSGYLQRPVYLTTIHEMGSYCDWTVTEFIPGDGTLVDLLANFPARDFVWCTARPRLRSQVASRLGADITLISDMTAAQVPTERVNVFHVVRR
jgi:hypothetical protein